MRVFQNRLRRGLVDVKRPYMFAVSNSPLEAKNCSMPHHCCCCHHHHETHHSHGRKQEVEHATDSEIAELTKAVERLNERIDELEENR
jgi:hypothetical protein